MLLACEIAYHRGWLTEYVQRGRTRVMHAELILADQQRCAPDALPGDPMADRLLASARSDLAHARECAAVLERAGVVDWIDDELVSALADALARVAEVDA